MSLSGDGILKLSVFPSPAAVGRYFDAPDGGPAGPSQTGNLVESGSGQLLSSGRPGDHRFRSVLGLKPARFAVQSQAGVPGGFHHRHVGLVHHFDPPQPFHITDALPAGDHQPQRIALLGTQRLAVLPIGHQNVVYGFVERNALGVFDRIRSFGHQPARALLHAGLPEQNRQRHSGPFTATGEPVRILDSRGLGHSEWTIWAGSSAVSVAFQEMKPRYRREAPQIFKSE